MCGGVIMGIRIGSFLLHVSMILFQFVSWDGSMILWEVTNDGLTKSNARHNVSLVPVYPHHSQGLK